jgi:hypothetical protein
MFTYLRAAVPRPGRRSPSATIGAVLLPAALLMAICWSGPALAGESTATGQSGTAASVYPPVSYTMQLSSASATVPAGTATRTTVSFRGSRSLYDAPVDLSISGLPSGVTPSFSPPTPLISGSSILILSTAPASVAGTFTITVNAIVTLDGGDPIGTSTTFDLTINAP